MSKKFNDFFKNLHLIISLIIVIPTAIIYGSPSILPNHLDIKITTNDLANMLKAIMALYLGISIVWVLGVFKSNYWKIATQLNILFIFSLAIGRTFSILTDGLPTIGYFFGIIAEFCLGLFSLYQLRRYHV